VDVAGAVDLNGQAFTVSAGLVTSAAGTVTITNAGTLSIADVVGTGDIASADLNLGGAFDQDGVGTVLIAGDITTSADAIDFTGAVTLTDTEFITNEGFEGPYYSNVRNPDENADLFVSDFSAYSMIHCFDIFTEEASMRIAREHELRFAGR